MFCVNLYKNYVVNRGLHNIYDTVEIMKINNGTDAIKLRNTLLLAEHSMKISKTYKELALSQETGWDKFIGK